MENESLPRSVDERAELVILAALHYLTKYPACPLGSSSTRTPPELEPNSLFFFCCFAIRVLAQTDCTDLLQRHSEFKHPRTFEYHLVVWLARRTASCPMPFIQIEQIKNMKLLEDLDKAYADWQELRRPSTRPKCWKSHQVPTRDRNLQGHSHPSDVRFKPMTLPVLHEHPWVTLIKSGEFLVPLHNNVRSPEWVNAGDFENSKGPVVVVAKSNIPIQEGDLLKDRLGMVYPVNLTPRMVSILCPEERIAVIDVEMQTSDEWQLNQFLDYFEMTKKRAIKNSISFEVSHTPLGRLIEPPSYVRNVDLRSLVVQEGMSLPSVQKYCLMSMADSYTDFHIDFGGSSLYYHMVMGKKAFLLAPPVEKNLNSYEAWYSSCDKRKAFFGWQAKDCIRVDLSKGDTLIIPAGWIHAVWTPEDSLAISGNFLTRTQLEMQFRVATMEARLKTPRNFLYPGFDEIMWCAVYTYLKEDPFPLSELRGHVRIGLKNRNRSKSGKVDNSRVYSRAEMDGFPLLRDYCIEITKTSKDTSKIQQALQIDAKLLANVFAVWCAWKMVPAKGFNLSPEDKDLMRMLAKESHYPLLSRSSSRNTTRQRSQGSEHGKCECGLGACGLACWNRVSMIECNPYNCPSENNDCGNRILSQAAMKHPVFKKKTNHTGWGLFSQQAVRPNTVILEIIGKRKRRNETQCGVSILMFRPNIY
jgi:hypothetical protein